METIKGYVDHIIYQNKDNGYAVLSMNVDDEEEICVGIFRGVDNGENLEITGEYVEHPSYGFQFKACLLYTSPSRMICSAWNVIWDPVPSKVSVRRWRSVL